MPPVLHRFSSLRPSELLVCVTKTSNQARSLVFLFPITQRHCSPRQRLA